MHVVSLMFCFVVASSIGWAQQVPNSNFEEWTLSPGSGQYKSYEEPSNGWASGNGVIHVAAGADAVCEKSTDAVEGTYSAKLVTQNIFGQVASGSVYTGKFVLNLSDPVKSALRGIPFTGRPTYFAGWFKYLPVDGDSATLYTTLSRWDGAQRVRVGEARITQRTPQETWQKFEQLFLYDSEEIPDTIAMVFASSAGGEYFRGGVGSTLFVDGAILDYRPLSVPATNEQASITITADEFRSDEPVQHALMYNLAGAVVGTWSDVSVINLNGVMPGVYGLTVTLQDGSIVRKVIVRP